MNVNTGHIVQMTDAEHRKELRAMEAGEKRDSTGYVPITANQEKVLTPLNAGQRKSWMRNQSCICSSGKKFKRCCWTKI